ncbi:hypothetical protein PMAYCL1PPCAC_02586, partial [Pristionchus mayeri]
MEEGREKRHRHLSVITHHSGSVSEGTITEKRNETRFISIGIQSDNHFFSLHEFVSRSEGISDELPVEKTERTIERREHR